jgi:hypothetical protein
MSYEVCCLYSNKCSLQLGVHLHYYISPYCPVYVIGGCGRQQTGRSGILSEFRFSKNNVVLIFVRRCKVMYELK